MSKFAYVGTYTTENKKNNRNAHGVGIYVFSITDDGSWDLIQQVPQLNPAVLAFGKDKKYIYCVNTNSNEISSFSRDEQTGRLTYMNSQKTSGKNAMVLSCSPQGDLIAVGDHSGLISCFKVNDDGTIGDETDAFMLPGEKGPLHEKIQPWSRPHHVPFTSDGRFMLTADKGLDISHSYKVDHESGKMELVQALKCRPASCPRHIAFHPNNKWLYINGEFSSQVFACHFDAENGTMEPFQIVPSLPDNWVGIKNMTSEIMVRPDGKTLYISNRGHESIGVFSIDDDGRLSPKQWVNCGGKKPRFFTLSPEGDRLYCGNQSSDTISVFDIGDDGLLSDIVKTIETPCPVWILFA
jgi:6-phosphogluconolactonase